MQKFHFESIVGLRVVSGVTAESWASSVPLTEGTPLVNCAADALHSVVDDTLKPRLWNKLRFKRVVLVGLTLDETIPCLVDQLMAHRWETWLPVDATAGREVQPGDTERTLIRLRERGVLLTDVDQLRTILAGHAPRPTALIVANLLESLVRPPGGLIQGPATLDPIRRLLAWGQSG